MERKEQHKAMWEWIAENLHNHGNNIQYIEKSYFEENDIDPIPTDRSYACQEARERWIDANESFNFEDSKCFLCPIEEKAGTCWHTGSRHYKIDWNLNKGTVEKAQEHALALANAWEEKDG